MNPRNLIILFGFGVASLLVGKPVAPANPAMDRKPDSFLSETGSAHHWFGFLEAGGLAALANGTSFAPYANWKPTYTFNERFAIRGSFGATAARNTNQVNQIFVIGDAELLAAFGLDHGVLEVGGGIQYWNDNGGMKPVISGNVAWPMPNDILGVIDRVVFGYSMYVAQPTVFHELKVGIGVAL